MYGIKYSLSRKHFVWYVDIGRENSTYSREPKLFNTKQEAFVYAKAMQLKNFKIEIYEKVVSQ